jgi:alpha-D-xyloside xylohydrolase
MNRKIITVLIFIFSLSLPLFAQLSTNGGTPYLLSQAKDMSADFADFTNLFFFADKLSAFDTEKAQGTIEWKRHSLYTRQAFNVNTVLPQTLKMLDLFDGFLMHSSIRFCSTISLEI